ncbi:MAG TPA: hypothetical protein VK711_10475 [Puia sp.]|jgi:hypothetical protein|nr:hypothetical protein [Puia sp.]
MKNKSSKIRFKLLPFLFIALIIFAFGMPKYSLVGKWTIYNSDGTSIGEYVDLKADNTYTVTLPDGTIGERGSYLFKDPVFSIKNIKDVCGKDYWGKYKLTFVGADSIHFALIEDSCSARRMDIVGYNPGLRRVKVK